MCILLNYNLSPLLEHQSTDNEALSSEDEIATTLDTSTDDVLSSENGRYLHLMMK